MQDGLQKFKNIITGNMKDGIKIIFSVSVTFVKNDNDRSITDPQEIFRAKPFVLLADDSNNINGELTSVFYQFDGFIENFQ